MTNTLLRHHDIVPIRSHFRDIDGIFSTPDRSSVAPPSYPHGTASLVEDTIVLLDAIAPTAKFNTEIALSMSQPDGGRIWAEVNLQGGKTWRFGRRQVFDQNPVW